MADAGLNAVEKALVTALSVAGVTALITSASRIHAMVIPPSATFPLVVFQQMTTGMEGRSFSGDAETYDYLVKGVTRGDYSVALSGDIAEAIDAALHGQTLSPTGYTGGIYGIKRQRWIRYVEQDEARIPHVHAGAIYRLWAHRS